MLLETALTHRHEGEITDPGLPTAIMSIFFRFEEFVIGLEKTFIGRSAAKTTTPYHDSIQ